VNSGCGYFSGVEIVKLFFIKFQFVDILGHFW